MLSGEPSHHGAPEGAYMVCPENPDVGGGRWYLSKKEIDENSPSRRDGIDLKKETQLRKSYCTYLQDLGMRLKVPQVTIATAIIFCHRFFLRQSHAKSDRMTVATVCMFLAGKVEETPRPLKDLILVSYDIIHKKNEAVARRIKQKDIYERQKELILLGERVVLTTLAFDLNVLHPYKPLVDAIKKFKVAKKPLAQVAWNFVNDGLRTSLCLQFKPRHIAAGAIFLAAKFLKVKLPVDSWWTEFDIQPRQLEEVSNQMLELYEQNRMLPSQTSEAEGGAGGSQRPQSRGPPDDENLASRSSFHDGPTTSKVVSTSLKKAPSRPVPEGPQAADNHGGPPIITRTQNTDNGSPETSSIPDQKGDGEFNDTQNHERESTPSHDRNLGETQNKSRFGADGNNKDDQGHSRGTELRDTVESKDEYHGRDLSNNDVTVSQSPRDATKLDEKLKAAMERKKACRTLTPKSEPVDDLETALEDVVVPNEKEKIKCEGKQSCTKSSHNPDYPNEAEALSHVKREQSSVEEGEFKPFDDSDKKYESPGPSSRKRKSDSPLDKPHEGNQRTDYAPGSQKQNHREYPDDRNGVAKA